MNARLDGNAKSWLRRQTSDEKEDEIKDDGHSSTIENPWLLKEQQIKKDVKQSCRAERRNSRTKMHHSNVFLFSLWIARAPRMLYFENWEIVSSFSSEPVFAFRRDFHLQFHCSDSYKYKYSSLSLLPWKIKDNIDKYDIRERPQSIVFSFVVFLLFSLKINIKKTPNKGTSCVLRLLTIRDTFRSSIFQTHPHLARVSKVIARASAHRNEGRTRVAAEAEDIYGFH